MLGSQMWLYTISCVQNAQRETIRRMWLLEKMMHISRLMATNTVIAHFRKHSGTAMTIWERGCYAALGCK